MRKFPLYNEEPTVAIEKVEPRELSKDCTACERYNSCASRCVKADFGGDINGILVLGSSPTRDDDAMGRPFIGQSGKFVRDIVEKTVGGRKAVTYDLAVRCYRKEAPSPEEIEACRPHLKTLIDELKPSRIICLGRYPVEAITGKYIPTFSVRRGYCFLYNTATPVFFIPSTYDIQGNKTIREIFVSDLKWALTTDNPNPDGINGICNVIQNKQDAEKAAEDLLSIFVNNEVSEPWLSFDCEYIGETHTNEFRLLSVQLVAKHRSNAYVWGLEALQNKDCIDILRIILTSKEIKKIGHFVKNDITAIRCALGFKVQGIWNDTHVTNKLLDIEAKSAGGGNDNFNRQARSSLSVLSNFVGLGISKDEMEEAIDENKKLIRKRIIDEKRFIWPHIPQDIENELRQANKDGNLNDILDKYLYLFVDESLRDRYGARDVVTTSVLLERRYAELKKEPELIYTFKEISQDAIAAFEQIESWGICIDKTVLAQFTQYIDLEIDKVAKTLAPYGYNHQNPEASTFNPSSNKQVAELVYTKLKLPVKKTTEKGTPAVDKEALKELANKHPVCAALSEWVHVNKMKSTYIDSIVYNIKDDGRIHPDFDITGARTGRLSAHRPAIQTIPRPESVIGKYARDLFTVPEGYTLIESDYSQLELRIAADLSGDPEMLAIYEAGVDFHTKTAEMISKATWGNELHEVDKDEQKRRRSAAKTVNFAILYGQGAKSLAQRIGCKTDLAETIIKNILGRFKVLAKWIKEAVEYTKATGNTHTYWNGRRSRRRQLWNINSQNDAEVSNATNASYNTIVQGTGSDYCTKSATLLVNWILENNIPAKVIGSVHDAILSEVRNDIVAMYAQKKKQIMCSHYTNKVKLEVDMKSGRNWGSLQKLVVP